MFAEACLGPTHTFVGDECNRAFLSSTWKLMIFLLLYKIDWDVVKISRKSIISSHHKTITQRYTGVQQRPCLHHITAIWQLTKVRKFSDSHSRLGIEGFIDKDTYCTVHCIWGQLFRMSGFGNVIALYNITLVTLVTRANEVLTGNWFYGEKFAGNPPPHMHNVCK